MTDSFIFRRAGTLRRFFKRVVIKNKKQTCNSMNWKDWSSWVLSKVTKYCLDAEEILEIGGNGKELGKFINGKRFRILNFPEEDICKKTSFPEEKFDLIYSKDTFEHLYNPFSAATEIVRILKVGGFVMIITVWAWRYHRASDFDDYWRFSEQALRMLFSDLEILESGYDISERRKDCRLDGVPIDNLGGWREHWHVYLIGRKTKINK